MIHHVEGQIAAKSSGRVVIDVAGIGYEIFVSLLTWNDLGWVGERTRMLTHLVVREDAWTLYGFANEEERSLFRMLLGVQGIGPKVALAMLSHVPAARLSAIVAQGDLAALTALPGIGKKTASRILVDLKDKLGSFETLSFVHEGGEIPSAALVRGADEVVDALVALGYSETSAREVVLAERRAQPSATAEKLLRDALRRL